MRYSTIKLNSNYFSNQEDLILTGETPREVLNSINGKQLIDLHICDKNAPSYERITLHDNDEIEIVFCHWQKGQGSLKHFHEDKSCWFKCIKGDLTETRDDQEKCLDNDKVYYIDDSIGAHQISNKSQQCTYTLHYYKREL